MSGIVVPDPHGGCKDAVVLDIVLEKVLHLRRKWVVGLHLDAAHPGADGNALGTQFVPVDDGADFPHKGAGVETKGVVTLLELVKFFNDGHGDYNVIVLELPDGIVVVQDDVGVQYEYFRRGLLFGRFASPHPLWYLTVFQVYLGYPFFLK